MGYYFREHQSKGTISFYPDHYWVMKDCSAENFRFETGEIVGTFNVSNVYDFSGDFPKLVKTTEETKNADGTLYDSQISTITSIDFTAPDVSLFDGKRYIGDKNLDDLVVARRRSPFQIAMMVAGVLMIAWGLWMRRSKKQK